MSSSSTPSSPLLGTPYLLSQATSSSSSSASSSSDAPRSDTHTRITPNICHSISLFTSLLTRSRQLSDDAIVTRLNRAAALSSSAVSGRGSREMGTTECEAVWREMSERWRERNEVLSYCDGVLRGDGKRERDLEEERGLSADRGDLGRGRRSETEIKLATLSTSLSVESIIRQRSLALFLSRCPSTAPPSSTVDAVSLPILGSTEERAREEERRRKARGRDERGNVRWT